MTLKDILVFVEDVEGGSDRLEYAVALAARLKAHITAVFVADALELHPHSGFAFGAGLANLMAEHKDQVQAAETKFRKMFDALGASLGLKREWRVSDHEWGEDLMLHARYADLTIVGPANGPSRRRTSLGLSEDMIFASGRPILLVPERWPSQWATIKVTIAWNGSAEAARAVAGAMPLLTQAGKIDIVMVQDAGFPVHEGFDPGKALARHLARHGVDCELHSLEGQDAGTAILGFANSANTDLLVMGAYGHSKLSEAIFGGATRHVLRHAEIPLLLSR